MMTKNTTSAEDCFGAGESCFCDDAEENYSLNGDSFGELAIRETAAMERHHWTLGYHDTYAESEEASLQKGFDDGYRDTYEVATCLGEILGQYAASIGSDLTLRRTQQRRESLEGLSVDLSYDERIKRLTSVTSHVKDVLSYITTGTSGAKNSITNANAHGSQEKDAIDSKEIDMTVMQQRREQTSRKLQELKREVEAVFLSNNIPS